MGQRIVELHQSRLLDISADTYRSLVVRRLNITRERRGVGWLSAIICSHPLANSEEDCPRCEAWAYYLPLAFTKEDENVPEGATRVRRSSESAHLWLGLETVDGDARDLELVRLDFDGLIPHSISEQ